MFRRALGATAGWVAMLVVASPSTSAAQPASAALDGPAPAGAALFAARCADCHGGDATGVRGPDLTRLWGAGATDERVFQTIRQGVPGSIMPPTTAPDAEVRALVAYVKALGTAGAGPGAGAAAGTRGSVAQGEQAFWTTCGGCHRVGQRGGRLGPDLTRIGVTQSSDALRTAIRRASAAITPGYQSVTLVTRDGARIRGLRKGEDAFSVQILDTRERLQGYRKADLASVARDAQSLMPDYGPDRLPDASLDDVVTFLATLKGSK
jgi:putative heme-binding domain-containing protein